MFLQSRPNIFVRASLLLSALVCSSTSSVFAAEEVNVYSYRKPELIQPMFDEFTTDTGIAVNVVFAKKGMLEKLKSEGINSPADLVFTVDIGRLSDIKNAGLTQSVESDVIESNVPANMQDVDNQWFGLTSRARIIVVSKDRIEDGVVTSYEDLADPEFKGLICTRSGKHAYMVALTASMIAHEGVAGAEQWLSGLKANLARSPEGNDRAQVKAVKEGVCDIAVINHYYMYQMISDPEQKAWADAVKVIFPNQQDRGTHMNVSGMAMTKYAPNHDNAILLMEYLSSDKAQSMYAELNGEYTVKPGIPLADAVVAWGEFKQDTVDLTAIAANRAEASKMADRVAYDE
jgi:iron(III) transport system substrate-binding protein